MVEESLLPSPALFWIICRGGGGSGTNPINILNGTPKTINNIYNKVLPLNTWGQNTYYLEHFVYTIYVVLHSDWE